eukprot:3615740-Prymnesium_polylepis.1
MGTPIARRPRPAWAAVMGRTARVGARRASMPTGVGGGGSPIGYTHAVVEPTPTAAARSLK